MHHTAQGSTWRVREWSRRLLWVGFALAALTEIVAFVAGLVAFFGAPRFDSFGAGPGGLWGVPTLVFMVSAALGVPMLLISLVRLALGHRRETPVLLTCLIPFAIAAGYFFVSHAFDPCGLGLLNASSEAFGEPLCGSWGGQPETSARLHLLHHALVPTLFLVILQALLLKKFVVQSK